MGKLALEASLGDIEFLQTRRFRHGVLGSDVMEFLKVDIYGIIKESSVYLPIDLPQVHRAIKSCFPNWQMVRETGGSEHNNDFWAPERETFELSPGKRETFLSAGAMFFQDSRGNRRVIVLDVDPKSRLPGPSLEQFRLLLIGSKSEEELIAEESQQLQSFVKQEEHYLSNAAIGPNGRLWVQSVE
jgi:hypothetical protein